MSVKDGGRERKKLKVALSRFFALLFGPIAKDNTIEAICAFARASKRMAIDSTCDRLDGSVTRYTGRPPDVRDAAD